MIDELTRNPSLARFLVVAIAVEARKNNARIKTSDFLVGFGRIVRGIVRNRDAFMDEFRQMEREGPDAYLRRISKGLDRGLGR